MNQPLYILVHMTILKLELENFMNIAKADLDFKNGINVISGKNGAGKSAVLEAIAFCMVERRRGDSWKDYIRSGTTGFKIHLLIQKSAAKADVVEFRYEGNIKQGATSKQIIYQGKTYVNSECSDFIKDTFDSEMLENIIFTLQDSKPVTHQTPLERRTIFKKIFNSNFTTAVEKIKADIEQKEAESTTLAYEINAIKSKTYPKVRLESMDPQELSVYLTEQSKIEDKMKESTFDNEFNTLYLSNREVFEKYVLPSYLNTRDDVTKLEKEIGDSLVKTEFCERDIRAGEARLNTLDINISGLKLKIEALEKSLDSESDSIGDLEKTLQGLRARIREAQVLRSISNTHLETHKKGKCDACGQDCDITRIQELETGVKVISRHIQDLISDENQVTAQHTSCVARVKEIGKTLDDLRNTLYRENVGVEKTTKNLENNRREITQDRLSTQSLQTILQEKTRELCRIEPEVDQKETWLKENESRWQALETSDPAIYEEQLKGIRAKIQDYNQRLTSRLEREAFNKKLDEQIQKDSDQVQKLSEKINTLDLEIKNLEFVKMFYETTFPNFINSKACTLLESYMNNFLSTTKEGFQFKLLSTKKGIDFLYKADPASEWLNVKLASGFETSVSNLAFKCAVAFSYQSGLLVLDEPDAYSSESNSERLFETLTSINDGFEQMIIITHKTQAMEFLKENGANIYKVTDGVFEQSAD